MGEGTGGNNSNAILPRALPALTPGTRVIIIVIDNKASAYTVRPQLTRLLYEPGLICMEALDCEQQGCLE